MRDRVSGGRERKPPHPLMGDHTQHGRPSLNGGGAPLHWQGGRRALVLKLLSADQWGAVRGGAIRVGWRAAGLAGPGWPWQSAVATLSSVFAAEFCSMLCRRQRFRVELWLS
ncbi:hypothetical protein GHT09_012001 [Marmota monax]|uniref:Uncharacterized protein n=1 Tax=Marmota monax TaxID=9995 RepID=A0A834QD33_MARMO|nr:hypothetical protein GHT09_012001 [Marmota monax]